jgi:type IV pilus assembly protein PilA
MPRRSSVLRARRRKAFTLVELLTVVLILSILMAVAMPLYLNAVDDSKKKVCRTNMQTISNAVMAMRVKSRSADFAGIITGGVATTNLPDLTAVPRCPNSGIYTLAFGASATSATFQVKCNATYPLTHGKFEPGIDHN